MKNPSNCKIQLPNCTKSRQFDNQIAILQKEKKKFVKFHNSKSKTYTFVELMRTEKNMMRKILTPIGTLSTNSLFLQSTMYRSNEIQTVVKILELNPNPRKCMSNQKS